ncbi:RNA polymerase sigma factor [Haliangium sp.]|uniref:RNA polymerase sigma factor n=1 Tax=Haliangium sp. TaxID=2663208 RepID=UPI003D0CC87F
MEATADLLRRMYPQVLARTLSFTRNLPEAEDAVQEAVVRALSTWPERGRPDAPAAWLQTVACNLHRDRLRRRKWETPENDALDTLAGMSPWMGTAVGHPAIARGWKDELLRLVFACCHPALEPGESAALCLATVVGMSTAEVALAFVAEPRAMEQRLTRARRRLRQRGDAEGTTPERSRERLGAVLRVIHLLFNEGYWSSDDGAPIRAEPCRLAIGLAHSLADAFPREPEVLGLLALLMLHDARRGARLSPSGDPIPLPEQDRTRWDHAAIAEATRLLDAALALSQPGPMQIEAAISAIHCRTSCAADTDWEQIATLYERLEELRPTPAVRVNRAFAVARAEGPEVGLAVLEDTSTVDATGYPYVHLVRGALLAELGRVDAARASLHEAHRRARNQAERAQIEARLARLPAAPSDTDT